MVDMTTIREGLMPEIEKVIEKVLDSKDETARRKALESAFAKASEQLENDKAAIDELTSAVESKEAEVASLNETVENLKTEHAEALEAKASEMAEADAKAQAALEEKDAELASLKEELETAKAALADIEAEKKAADRFAELEEAEVAFASEEQAVAQKARVRGMSDDEFNAYKTELVTLAEQFKAKASETSSEVVDDGKTPPPEITKAGKESASLDVEGKETASTYSVKEIGDAMVARMRSLDGKETA